MSSVCISPIWDLYSGKLSTPSTAVWLCAFPVKSVLKPCTVDGQRTGAENPFLAEIFENFHFYLILSFVHNNLVPGKITIHSALLQHLLFMCYFSST